MTKYGIMLAIMDKASAKSDVNGPKKIMFLGTLNWKRTKTKTKNLLKSKNHLYIVPGWRFYIFLLFRLG